MSGRNRENLRFPPRPRPGILGGEGTITGTTMRFMQVSIGHDSAGQGAHVNNRTPEMDPVARTAAGWCLSSRVGRLRRAAACRIVRRYNAAEGGARRPLRPIHAGQAGEVEA